MKQRNAFLKRICILLALLLCACGGGQKDAEGLSSPSPEPVRAAEEAQIDEVVSVSTPTPSPVPTPTPTPEPTPTPTPTPTPEPTPEPTPTGLCGGRFPDKFSVTPELSELSYSDSGLSITITRYDDNREICRDIAVYFVADVYLQDVERWKTAAAGDNFAVSKTDKVVRMAKAHNALFALSGDYFNYQSKGLIIRNGVLYRNKYDTRRDLCVLYRDGVLKTFEANTYTAEEIIASDPWQTWQFGPGLLDENGEPKTEFNTSLSDLNPRCAIGYFEPGHYCFVVVDGRRDNYSKGATMRELALIMHHLGCVAAYNLDGGLSAQMYFNGSIRNRNSGGRAIGDIIYFLGSAEG